MSASVRARQIGRLQRGAFFRREADIQGGNRLVDVLGAGRADDRRGDAGLRGDPGERDLRRGHAACGSDCRDRVDHRFVGVATVEFVGEIIGFGTFGSRSNASERVFSSLFFFPLTLIF